MIADKIDEKLMRLADGELDAAEEAELRPRIEVDPVLAERFALFVETRALLVGEIPAAKAEPVPERLIAAIQRVAGKSAAAPPTLTVVAGAAGGQRGAAAPGAPRVARAPSVWRMALAASILALVAGGVIGYGLAPGLSGRLDPALADLAALPGAKSAIAEALATTPSGQVRRWSDAASGLSGEIKIIATHRMADGVCREYEVAAARADMARQTMVSCRRGAGWQTQIVVFSHVGTGYVPANGGHEAIEQMLAAIGSRGVVTGEEEAQLLRGR